MSDQTKTTIAPTARDVEAWRLSAEWFVKFGGVKLGEFNWPQAVLSLAAETEHVKMVMRECCDAIRDGDEMGAMRMLEVCLTGGGRKP